MPISRRDFLTTLPTLIVLSQSVAAQPTETRELPLPNKSTFQNGDLVWPKKPRAIVLYRSGHTGSFEEEEERWIKERDSFLDSLKSRPSHLSASQINELRGLTFREFHARYAGDQNPDSPGVYSSGSGLYVGHVGLIEIDSSGTPWVIEALWGQGIVRSEYGLWLEGRPGEIVWHGRLRDLGDEERTRIVPEARKHIGKPYDFWNFDLNDDTGFYCSKLVWLSVFRSLGLAVDANQEAKRGFWFSPKQLLYANTIARLHDPGPYANS